MFDSVASQVTFTDNIHAVPIRLTDSESFLFFWLFQHRKSELRHNSRWNGRKLDTGRQLHAVGNLIIDYITHIPFLYSTQYITSVLPQSSLSLSARLVRCKIGAFMLMINNRDALG
jgi:hypothetical protein